MSRTPVLLTVDDNAAGRYVKTRILREAGYVALEAETGEEGLAVTDSKRPDRIAGYQFAGRQRRGGL
jgi:CheY-like chemotaxis protein